MLRVRPVRRVVMSERKPRGRGKPKPIVVEDAAWINTGTLRGARKDEVEAILRSEGLLRGLVEGAKPVGSAGKLLASGPAAGMRFIFKPTPRDYRLVQLLPAKGFDDFVVWPAPKKLRGTKRPGAAGPTPEAP